MKNTHHTTNPLYTMRWLLSCLIFLCYSCTHADNYNSYTATKQDSLKEEQRISRALVQIDAAKNIITTGDLIVRTGNDFTSESLRSLNQRDQTYSHCGIASVEHDSVFVYHALGGEWNPDQKIRRDPFVLFAEPYSNRGIGIYRFDLSKALTDSLMTTVKNLYQMGIMFDMKFDLKNNDHMYCAEFVYKSYLLGTNGKLQFHTSHLGNFEFIGVDDLFLQPMCREQKKILFQ